MRGYVIAAAAALLAAPAAAKDAEKCPTGAVCASDPARVAAAMTAEGYQAKLEKDDTGDPMIRSAASGYNYSLLFYGCEKHAQCDSLQFYASFEGDPSRAAAFANKWNRSKRFSQMSVRDDDTIVLSYDVTTVGGVRTENFKDVLVWWNTMLGELSRFFDENPVPKKEEKAT